MGDKSPKSKKRGQSQKNASKASDKAKAKAKQDGQSKAPDVGKGGKK